jgi:glycosyltransferase involved in cell wall biosynthesis
MRIAYFHTATILSSWSVFSMADTLRAMGHEVLDGMIPTNAHGQVLQNVGREHFNRTVALMPTLEDLQSCGVVLVAGPEYIDVWLNSLYGKEQWCKLNACRVAFFLESTGRKDLQLRYETFTHWFDLHYFPDRADASRLGGRHMKGSVDLEMFRPCEKGTPPNHTCDQACYSQRMAAKKYDAAFVGSLYPKRMEFLYKLLPLLPDVEFHANGVAVRDLGGECQREWAELLAKNIRQIKIHVALPSNNMRMMVSRPFETLACGTFLLTYDTKDNPFRDGVHCRIYDPENPRELADLIRYYIAHEAEREAIATAGCEEVRTKYSLRQRLSEVLDAARGHRRLPASPMGEGALSKATSSGQ